MNCDRWGIVVAGRQMARVIAVVVLVTAMVTVMVPAMIPALVSPAWAEWEPEDEFWADVDGSTVKVSHRYALYNCGIAGVAYEVTGEEPGEIAVTERDIEGEQLDCMCYFLASFYLWDVPAGDWIVALNYLNYEDDAWRVVDIPFTIAADDGDEIAMGDFEKSDCLSAPTAVPEEEWPDFLSWTTLKVRYR